MKLTLIQIILFAGLCSSASTTMAQQAKSYETVKYTATIKYGVFHLDYAEGYIAASKIRLVNIRQNAKLFIPDSGSPDAKGNFVLRSNSVADKQQILLTGISEETEAPDIIRASYREKGKAQALLFHKINLRSDHL